MSEYKAVKVNLPVAMWDKLDKMVEEQGKNVTVSFHVQAAVGDYLNPRTDRADILTIANDQAPT